MPLRLFRRQPVREAASVFDALNSLARDPALFGEGRVADTPDGRFEVVTLFATILFRRLKGRSEALDDLSQCVFDRLFKSFDQAMRDLGVGDLSVGKRIRKLAESFYGRLAAYNDALDSGEDGAFVEAVGRNVLGVDVTDHAGEAPAACFASTLARVALDFGSRLDTVSDAALLQGKVDG